jgi:glutamate-5-semialdehyde dehydrogenase
MSGYNVASQGRAVAAASRLLATASHEVRNAVLLYVADALSVAESEILSANQLDVEAFDDDGPGRDRLLLTAARIASMAEALRTVAALPDPLGEEVEHSVRPNGLEVSKRRVPLGVVGVIYENRPNVTCDVAGLCIKSGNAAFLRGSSSALRTNQVLVSLWHRALRSVGLSPDSVALVTDTSHEVAEAFMRLDESIDCLIPRGGPSLIAAMKRTATVPYVIDGDGNCHVYVDASADLEMALAIVENAKVSRPGVCNAAETLLVHAAVADEFLPALAALLGTVELRVDERAGRILTSARRAETADFENEFLDLVLAVAVVESLDEAIEHVARYGSGHSEAIVTSDAVAADAWVRRVDAAAVVVNASTRFVDGGELGLGGEVGISTQKLHARGPMGVRELTCLKWVVRGKGHIR